MIITILIFIAVLSVLVFAHELGHFVMAKRFGVRADEFGFGFPPRVFGFYKNKLGRWRLVRGNRPFSDLEESNDEADQPAHGATIYSVNSLPLGGFVKIKGENDNDDKEPDSLAAKKIWQRIAILSAGVIMNVVVAWIFLSLAFVSGIPSALSEAGPNAKIEGAKILIYDVEKNSPAEDAGLKSGDYLLSIDGVLLSLEKDVQDLVATKADTEIFLEIERDGEILNLSLVPSLVREGRAVMGVGIMSSAKISYSFFRSFVEGAKYTAWILKEIVVSLAQIISQIFSSGQSVEAELAGPVGIAKLTGQMARLGWAHLLQFTALLSLNLAVINILPFPALDGGRILFLIIEKIKGRPVKRDLEAWAHNIGFLLLIALVIFVTYKDVAKLFVK